MQKGFTPIVILVGILILGLVAGGVYYFTARKPVYVANHVTGMQCDAKNRCPENLECWILGGYDKAGAWCVDPNPAEWYCEGKVAAILESYPPILKCNVAESSKIVETANWKTYDSVGLEFKYPADFGWRLAIADTNKGSSLMLYCDPCSPQNTVDLVSISSLASYKSIKEYLSTNKLITDYQEIKIDGLDAIQAVVSKGTLTNSSYIENFVVHKNQGEIIAYRFIGLTDKKKLTDFPVMNPDILSTVKFN